MHWQQGGVQPPTDVASSFYPVRGVYSSADALVVDAQMSEIAAAGIGVVITSWWGRGSREDRRLPQLLGAARRHGLSVAAHLEPYRGRTVESTEADIGYLRGLGISDVYVWASSELPDRGMGGDERANRRRPRLREHEPRRAAPPRAASTASTPTTSCSSTAASSRASASRRVGCTSCAHRRSARATTPGAQPRDLRVKPRRDGARYDGMWRGALRAEADLVTVTSYNEWHEGTQIEPARGRPERLRVVRGRLGPPRPRGRDGVSGSHRLLGAAPHARLTTSAEQLETSASSTSAGVDAAQRRRARDRPRSRAMTRARATRAPSSAPKQSSALGREDAAPAGLTARDPLELPQLLERIDADVRVRADARAGCRGARSARRGGSRPRDRPRSSGTRRRWCRSRRAGRARRRRRASRGRPWRAGRGSPCVPAARSAGSRAPRDTPRSRAAARTRGCAAAVPRLAA